MAFVDELRLARPVYGSRKLTVLLRQEGLAVNRKRVVRLLRVMGIEAIYAKPRTSLPEPGHQIYPYVTGSAYLAAGEFRRDPQLFPRP